MSFQCRIIVTLVVLLSLTFLMVLHTEAISDKKNQMTNMSVHLSNDLGAYVSRLHRYVRLFAREQVGLIESLVKDPENDETREQINLLLSDYFPDVFAFTVTNTVGDDLLDDFDQQIGDICRNEINLFVNENRLENPVLIHPMPDNYHFDVMESWGKRKKSGVFFVSFYAKAISRMLVERELPDQRIMLVKRSDPRLIEITTLGSRDKLNGEIRLTDVEAANIVLSTSVPNSQWDLIVMDETSNSITHKTWFPIMVLIVFAVFMGIWVVMGLGRMTKSS